MAVRSFARVISRGRLRSAPGACGGKSGDRALTNQVALELGEGRKDAEYQPACGAGRVDAAGEHLQANSLGLQPTNQLDEVTERTADPIEFPDDQGVARPHVVERLGEAGPLGN